MNFEQIYKQYWQKIFRLCLAYTNNYSTAQDICQESFIKVWQQLPNFRNEASIDTWIYRIASNYCLKHIEKSKKIIITKLPFQLKDEKRKNVEPQIQLLYQFIAELKEIERIIISLELEEIKQAEIAEIVGLSEANVRVKIHRIKNKLTQKFKNHGK